MATVGAIINNRYRIEQPIGSGGMSTVYRAIDLKLNILYAIKEIQKNTDNEIIAETSMNEVNLLKGLNNNHIPRIIDIIEDDFHVFVVQEFVQGVSLEQLLETEKKFPQEIVVEWMKQMCNVLYYLHSKDIIHRDIKPGNIMYTPNSADGNEAGHITLIDFGIGRTYKKGKTKDTVAYLTEAFAAPEQKKQIGQSNPRTDIYSLGLTMYTLVTGLYPDDTIEIKKITDIDASLSTGLEKIITKCTMENPDERYQSCLELLYDLEHYKESEELYIKKQRSKVIKFASAVAMFLTFITLSGIFKLAITSMESKNYGLIL
ncbi:MAG: serine/threonine-protein kinase, partial [Ruminococcus sp.]